MTKHKTIIYPAIQWLRFANPLTKPNFSWSTDFSMKLNKILIK